MAIPYWKIIIFAIFIDVKSNPAVTVDATGIEDAVLGNDFGANGVGCQTDPRKEDELFQLYQSKLLSGNEEVYRLRAENDALTRKSKVFGFHVIKGNNKHLYPGPLPLFMSGVDGVRDNVKVCRARPFVEDHVLLVFMKPRLGFFTGRLCSQVWSRINYRIWCL